MNTCVRKSEPAGSFFNLIEIITAVDNARVDQRGRFRAWHFVPIMRENAPSSNQTTRLSAAFLPIELCGYPAKSL